MFTYYYVENDFQKYMTDSNALYAMLFNDTNRFFDIVFSGASAKELHAWTGTFQDIDYNDSRTLILTNTIIRFVSGGNVLVHVFFFCFISFVGLFALYKAFFKYLEIEKQKYLLLLFFIPTVLFWSSGVFKESLLLLGIGVFLYACDFGLRKSYTAQLRILAVLAFVFLLFIKPYVLITLLPGLLVNTWCAYTTTKDIFKKYLLFFSIAFVSVIVFNKLFSEKNIFTTIINKQQKMLATATGGVYLLSKDYFVCVDYSKKEDALIPSITDSVFKIKKGTEFFGWQLGYDDGVPFIKDPNDKLFFKNISDTISYKLIYEIVPSGSLMKPMDLQPNVFSFLKSAPLAFVKTLLIPLTEKQLKKIYYLNSFENTLFILGLLFMFLSINKNSVVHPVFLFSISFALLLFVLIAYTTPLVGALVRLKMPALPFLFFSILLIVNKDYFSVFKKRNNQ